MIASILLPFQNKPFKSHPKIRKKRREVLEYEEEIDEEKFDGMMASSLDNPMPGGFELPEDTTGTGDWGVFYAGVILWMNVKSWHSTYM